MITVETGRVTGFLGPNGAGKSTTMRVIVGIAHALLGDPSVLILDEPANGWTRQASATSSAPPSLGSPPPGTRTSLTRPASHSATPCSSWSGFTLGSHPQQPRRRRQLHDLPLRRARAAGL
jgi:ABC-2 type transport system ATP-binding protein